MQTSVSHVFNNDNATSQDLRESKKVRKQFIIEEFLKIHDLTEKNKIVFENTNIKEIKKFVRIHIIIVNLSYPRMTLLGHQTLCKCYWKKYDVQQIFKIINAYIFYWCF